MALYVDLLMMCFCRIKHKASDGDNFDVVVAKDFLNLDDNSALSCIFLHYKCHIRI
jgi:hypothetical protein